MGLTMNKPIRVKESTQKPIRVVGSTQPRLDPAEVARALGGEPTEVTRGSAPAPLSLFAMRGELFNRLHSSGGRPALEGTSRRPKIPLSEQDWQQLENLAASLASADCAPSAGQVASVLLSRALRELAAQGADEKLAAALAQEAAKSD